MAAPVTPIIYNFNGTDANPDSGHYTALLNNIQRVSNQGAGTNAGTNIVYLTGVTHGANCEEYITIATKPGAGNSIALIARAITSSLGALSGYEWVFTESAGTDTMQMFRLDNLVGTQLGSTVNQEFAAGDKLFIKPTGTTLEGWWSNAGTWTLQLTTTDSTYASGGSVVFAILGTSGRVDDEGGGTLFSQSAAGTLTSAGAIVKQTSTSKSGTLTTVGSLVKQTFKTFAGTLTSAGTLTAFKVALVSLTGTLTTAGTLVKQTNKSFTGALTSSGALVKQTFKTFAGTLTTSGSLLKQTNKVFTGTLTSAGALVKQANKNLTGTLTTAGAIVKQINHALSGVLATVGALSAVLQGGTPISSFLGTISIDNFLYGALLVTDSTYGSSFITDTTFGDLRASDAGYGSAAASDTTYGSENIGDFPQA